jgi:hypothetical protein
MKTLFVAWKDSANTRAWYPVGRLDADVAAQRYRFRYLQGALQANRDCGFVPFDSFPQFDKNYVSAELFPLFANRLQNASRPSFQEYLRRLDFEFDAPDAINPIELLGASEGRRVTDNLEVFPKVERSVDGSFSIKFFLHGWRRIHPYAAERINALQPNERLGVSIETTNPVTTWALQIQTADYVIIGWAPRYLFEDLIHIIGEGACTVEATVARINPAPAPPGQRLMVRFRGYWPDGYEPMASENFRPLVADEMISGSKLERTLR